MMTRGPLGETVQVTFQNEGGAEQSVELTLSEDIEGRDVQINTELAVEDYDPLQLPVEVSMLDSGIAVIRINNFFADPIMMTSAWNTAIDTLNSYGIPGLIIDVRDNGGGLGNIPLYMAGSFYDTQFDLFDSELIDANGAPYFVGTDTVYPVAPRYEFPIALIVDEGCASACEIFAAAIAHNPDNLIVGYNPTAGVEAGVYFWALPGGIQFQASILRVTSDGEIAVEGVGVPPNVVVPRTRDNLLNPEDELLLITEETLIPVIVAFFEEPMPETSASPEAMPDASPEASPVATPAA
jgi:carboxyl-terminal processing protease